MVNKIDWDTILVQSLDGASVISEEDLKKSLSRGVKRERSRYATPAELVRVVKKFVTSGVLALVTTDLDTKFQKGTRNFKVDLSKLGQQKNPKKTEATTAKKKDEEKTLKVREIRLRTNKFTAPQLRQILPGKIENFGEAEGYSVFGIQLDSESAKIFLAEIAPKLKRGEDMFDSRTTPETEKLQRIVWKMSDFCNKNGDR